MKLDPTKVKHLTFSEVAAKLTLTLPEFQSLCNREIFPRSEMVVKGIAAWTESTVLEWIAKQPKTK